MALCHSLMCLSVAEGAEITDAEADWRTVRWSDGLSLLQTFAFWPLNRLVGMKRSFDLTQMSHPERFTRHVISLPAFQIITKLLQSSLMKHHCNPG